MRCVSLVAATKIKLDRERMESLLLAGLGKAKIVFPNKKATHEEFPVLPAIRGHKHVIKNKI